MTIGKILRMTAPTLAAVLIIGLGGVAQAATATSAAAATAHRAKLPGYRTLDAARSACGSDAVVWHATGSKVFHSEKSKYFGKTRHGAYVCEKAALADHLHASKY